MKQGFLEVGTNGLGEVVINHPDLKPDKDGIGHIVFSVDEAYGLARLLEKMAGEARHELTDKRMKDAEKIPVDRSAQELVSGLPVPQDF